MNFCENCIHYEMCKWHEPMISDNIITFFPHNEDCALFQNKADFVEVVRCKDCKCYLAVTYNGEPMHYGYCKNKHDDILGNRHRFEGDYCSYGEIKERF